MEIVVPDEFQYLYVQDQERPVVKIPHPILRQSCTEVARVTPKIEKLIDTMMKAMKKANGVGLAAPQMGSGLRLFVMQPLEMKPMAVINPVITEKHGEQVGEEGCLSIPGLYGDVQRALKVVVEGFDRKGRGIALELEGLPARVAQHEIDHLDGVLFIDKVDLATLHWVHPGGDPDDEEN